LLFERGRALAHGELSFGGWPRAEGIRLMPDAGREDPNGSFAVFSGARL
jgi:hypothetical protein